jgi:hypothetical protein
MSKYFFIVILLCCSCSSDSFQTNADNPYQTRKHVYFDKPIAENEVELELFKAISSAKSRVLLKNYPALKTSHTQNNPDLFVDLLHKLKKKGVNITIIHEAPRGLYPLSKTLLMHGINTVYQNGYGYNYGVVEKGTKYAIVDDKVIVIEQKDDDPRYVEFIVDKNDIQEDFKYTLEYILENQKRR